MSADRHRLAILWNEFPIDNYGTPYPDTPAEHTLSMSTLDQSSGLFDGCFQLPQPSAVVKRGRPMLFAAVFSAHDSRNALFGRQKDQAVPSFMLLFQRFVRCSV